jgi:hypothetical protein
VSTLYLHEVVGTPLGPRWQTRQGHIVRTTARRVFVREGDRTHALDRQELEACGVCRGWSRHDTHPPIDPVKHWLGVWIPPSAVNRGAVFVHGALQ